MQVSSPNWEKVRSGKEGVLGLQAFYEQGCSTKKLLLTYILIGGI